MIIEGLEIPFICRIAEVTPEYVENVRQELTGKVFRSVAP